MNEINEIMIGAMAGLALGYAATTWRKKDKATKLLEIRNFVLEATSILDQARRRTGAHHVLLFNLHNGGSPMTVTSEKYSTIVAESTASDAEKVEWDRVKVDFAFVEMAADLQKNGKRIIYTESMQPSMLQRRLEAVGVNASIAIKVYDANPKNFFYAAFRYTDTQPTEAQFGWAELYADNLRRLVEQYDKKKML